MIVVFDPKKFYQQKLDKVVNAGKTSLKKYDGVTESEFLERVGNNIEILKDKKGLTEETLSNKIEKLFPSTSMDQKKISQIIKYNQKRLKAFDLYLLATGLEVSVEDIIGVSNSSASNNELNNTIIENIKKLLFLLFYVELGEKVGLNEEEFEKCMWGSDVFTLTQICKIADHFSVSGEYIIGESSLNLTKDEFKNFKKTVIGNLRKLLLCKIVGLNEDELEKSMRGSDNFTLEQIIKIVDCFSISEEDFTGEFANSEFNNTVIANIRKLSSHHSDKELAKIVELNEEEFKKRMGGSDNFTLVQISKIADSISVPVEDIIGESSLNLLKEKLKKIKETVKETVKANIWIPRDIELSLLPLDRELRKIVELNEEEIEKCMGERFFILGQLSKIADYFSVSVEDIIGKSNHSLLTNRKLVSLLNYKVLGKIVEMDAYELVNCMQGKDSFTLEQISKIADYFSVSVDYLLGRKGHSNIEICSIISKLIETKDLEVETKKIEESSQMPSQMKDLGAVGLINYINKLYSKCTDCRFSLKYNAGIPPRLKDRDKFAKHRDDFKCWGVCPLVPQSVVHEHEKVTRNNEYLAFYFSKYHVSMKNVDFIPVKRINNQYEGMPFNLNNLIINQYLENYKCYLEQYEKMNINKGEFDAQVNRLLLEVIKLSLPSRKKGFFTEILEI